MAKKRPNKVEREWMTKVASYGCVACEIDGLVKPAEIHHIRKHTGMGLKPSHFNILPLCASHHSSAIISLHLGKIDFYSKFCSGELIVTDSKTAEMVKLSENSFRDVNIAFANELSIIKTTDHTGNGGAIISPIS